MFSKHLDKLKETGIISFEQKIAGKPRELRLYSLRKWFRKQAAKAGIEYVNFWMGHKGNYQAPHIPDSDAHYFSREDVEFHRRLYAEKAMPFLRLEARTPTETEETIKELQTKLADRDKKISDMRWRMRELTKAIMDMQEQKQSDS